MARTDTQREQLVTHFTPRSGVAEAYRTLRTNIQFSSLDHPLRSLLVTSCGPDEGKSTVAANLAVVMAQAGNRIILVDCDLRRPSQHQMFGVDHEPGLTTLVLNPESRRVLPLRETAVPNLRLLPSGPLPPNPSDVVGSRRMEEVLELLKEEADLVLLDSPPVVAVTDAALLASRVDGVLLVLRANKTKRDVARKGKALLDKVNARLLGVVLNGVKSGVAAYGYYDDKA